MSLGPAYDRLVREFLNRNAGNVLIDAHAHSSYHRDELEKSTIVGCFDCLGTFSPGEITEWADGGDTAICPRCSVDAIIGDASGYPVTDSEFLSAMHNQWFSSCHN